MDDKFDIVLSGALSLITTWILSRIAVSLFCKKENSHNLLLLCVSIIGFIWWCLWIGNISLNDLLFNMKIMDFNNPKDVEHNLVVVSGIVGLIIGFDPFKIRKIAPIFYYLACGVFVWLYMVNVSAIIDFGLSFWWEKIFFDSLLFILTLTLLLLYPVGGMLYASRDVGVKRWYILIMIILSLTNFFAQGKYNRYAEKARIQRIKQENPNNGVYIYVEPETTQSPSSSSYEENNSLDCSQAKHYCTQMVSCSEAKLAYQCGNYSLDRDNDGIPCDNLCQ